MDVYGSDFNETINSRNTVAGEAPVISTTADNQYYYTDEFTGAPGIARATLNDTNGGLDVLNASAVSTNSIINLNNGTTSTIAGRTFTINGNVEFAFGGDDGTDLFKVLKHISLMRRMNRAQINRRNTLRYSARAIHRSSATKNVIPIAKEWTLNQ